MGCQRATHRQASARRRAPPHPPKARKPAALPAVADLGEGGKRRKNRFLLAASCGTFCAVGFYVTDTIDTLPAKADASGRSLLAKSDLPSKNRVMGSWRSAATRARFPASEPVETHWETDDTPTKTVPGLASWLSRDPIGESGGRGLYMFVYNAPPCSTDPFGLDVYVVARNLTDLQPDDVTKYVAIIDKLVKLGMLSADKASDYKTLLEWYGKKTWHCSIVVMDCNDEAKLKKLKKSNISEWNNVNGDHTADFNNAGVHVPGSDWAGGTFRSENYKYRVNITRLAKGHKYDQAVLNAFVSNNKPGSAFDMGGANHYNCCDWAAQTLGVAGLTYKNPNPKPFGDTPHFGLWLMSKWSGVDIGAEVSKVFDSGIAEFLEDVLNLLSAR